MFEYRSCRGPRRGRKLSSFVAGVGSFNYTVPHFVIQYCKICVELPASDATAFVCLFMYLLTIELLLLLLLLLLFTTTEFSFGGSSLYTSNK